MHRYAFVIAVVAIVISCGNNSGTGTSGAGGSGCPSFPHVKYITDTDGGCVFAGCENLWGDCNGDAADGCEIDLRADATCGNCRVACALPERCISTCDDAGQCLTGCQ